MASPADDARALALVVSCEHAGRTVPRRFARLFAGQGGELASHRGWDPGALELAREMATAFATPLHACATTRLLVEVNRSPHHPHLFSHISRFLPQEERERVLAEIYHPYREAVAAEIEAHLTSGRDVLHVLVHSFTPIMDGADRRTDLALLYDPARPREKALADAWLAAIATRAPVLRLRRNYPYKGTADGLEVAFRRRFPPERYLGITLEACQAFPLGAAGPWRALRSTVIEALAECLGRE